MGARTIGQEGALAQPSGKSKSICLTRTSGLLNKFLSICHPRKIETYFLKYFFAFGPRDFGNLYDVAYMC